MSRLAADSAFLRSLFPRLQPNYRFYLFLSFFPWSEPSDLSGDVPLTPFLSVGHEEALRNELRLLCVTMSFSLGAVFGSDSAQTFPLDLPKKVTSLFYSQVSKKLSDSFSFSPRLCLLYSNHTSVCTLTDAPPRRLDFYIFTIKTCFASLLCRNFLLSALSP